mmetsp:Transcript_29464/g.82297  ORF Transcript_29464/g.82297 Transcript_29464/m.82297 type:complete len:217 (+) Transcript_29464:354-1004(+)
MTGALRSLPCRSCSRLASACRCAPRRAFRAGTWSRTMRTCTSSLSGARMAHSWRGRGVPFASWSARAGRRRAWATGTRWCCRCWPGSSAPSWPPCTSVASCTWTGTRITSWWRSPRRATCSCWSSTSAARARSRAWRAPAPPWATQASSSSPASSHRRSSSTSRRPRPSAGRRRTAGRWARRCGGSSWSRWHWSTTSQSADWTSGSWTACAAGTTT